MTSAHSSERKWTVRLGESIACPPRAGTDSPVTCLTLKLLADRGTEEKHGASCQEAAGLEKDTGVSRNLGLRQARSPREVQAANQMHRCRGSGKAVGMVNGDEPKVTWSHSLWRGPVQPMWRGGTVQECGHDRDSNDEHMDSSGPLDTPRGQPC